MRAKLIFMACFIATALSFAKEEVLFEFDESKPKIETQKVDSVKTVNQETKKPSKKKKINNDNNESGSNLPDYYTNRDLKKLSKLEIKIEQPKESKNLLNTVSIGDSFEAVIEHWVIAFPDEKAPVIARITSGALKGAKVLGESTLEKNSKKINITFKYISKNGQTYETSAKGITEIGSQGFDGEYHSNEVGLFSGAFISAFVGAFFSAQVPQTQTPFGTIQKDTSIDSAFKSGIAGGAMETADMFKEKLKKIPEFSELKGPIKMKILITDDVKEK